MIRALKFCQAHGRCWAMRDIHITIELSFWTGPLMSQDHGAPEWVRLKVLLVLGCWCTVVGAVSFEEHFKNTWAIMRVKSWSSILNSQPCWDLICSALHPELDIQLAPSNTSCRVLRANATSTNIQVFAATRTKPTSGKSDILHLSLPGTNDFVAQHTVPQSCCGQYSQCSTSCSWQLLIPTEMHNHTPLILFIQNDTCW